MFRRALSKSQMWGGCFVLGLALTLSVGCGLRNGNQFNQDNVSAGQASQVSSALTSASTEIQREASTQAVAFKNALDESKEIPSGSWFSGTLQQFTIDGSFSNPNGSGDATITGNGSFTNDKFTMSLTVTMTNWSADDLSINGALALNFQMAADGKINTTTTVKGTVNVGGINARTPEIVIPVTVDVQINTQGTQATTCGTVADKPVGSGAC